MKNNVLLKIYLILSAGAILFAGLLHLFRLIYNAPVVIGTISVPMFLSYFGLAGSIGIVGLAVWLFRKNT
jgi:hypothetical protein